MKIPILLLLLCGHASALSLVFDAPPPDAFTIDFETPPPLGVNWDAANVYPAAPEDGAAPPKPFGSGNFLAANEKLEQVGSTSITFDVKLDYLGFYWGSPDIYNTIEFFNAGISQGSFTGALVPPANGDKNASPYVGFTGGIFDRVDLTSTYWNFEVDTLRLTTLGGTQLPEPSAALLSVGVLTGVMLRRRRKISVAEMTRAS